MCSAVSLVAVIRPPVTTVWSMLSLVEEVSITVTSVYAAGTGSDS